NLESVRSVNWYVQMLYGTNRGTHVLRLTEDGKPVTGGGGLYASAVWDSGSKTYIVKIVNASDAAQDVSLNFRGAKKLSAGSVTTLHSDDLQAVNTLRNKTAVVPQTANVTVTGNTLECHVDAHTFAVYRIK
ncbi:MAG: alpha-L-arabinofuranosidase, partial [Prevotella sp.]|nr:alpha-L-arabinofuranosidase [Prevotella sp.]